MIYKVNTVYDLPQHFDVMTNPNAKADAEELLAQVRSEVLKKEAIRFSICATFVNGNDATWREVQDSDPEDTVCQVFDSLTGTYTKVATKTEAYALNEQRKQEFLTSCGLDTVTELEEMPTPVQPTTQGTQTL
jgi:hypothetical protein